MEINLAWLLVLPITFALGWIAARFDRSQHWKESLHVSRDTLTAMSALLADNPAKATDALLSAARSAPDAVELHQAVGSLYRKRGMTDRAIEVHEAALRHPSIEPADRPALLLDLARDYAAAGLFDRAESVLGSLLQAIEPLEKTEALLAMANDARLMLMENAQRIRNWEGALHWAKEARKHDARFRSERFEQLTGHFHCELAIRALGENKTADAQRYLELAAGSGAAGPMARAAAIGAPQSADAANASQESACRICGFRSRQKYWQCPGCHHWDSFEAIS